MNDQDMDSDLDDDNSCDDEEAKTAVKEKKRKKKRRRNKKKHMKNGDETELAGLSQSFIKDSDFNICSGKVTNLIFMSEEAENISQCVSKMTDAEFD